MEARKMIQDLLDSDVKGNKELAVGLLSNPKLTEEDRLHFIPIFEEMVKTSEIFKEENKNLLELWLEVYEPLVKVLMKKRINRIE